MKNDFFKRFYSFLNEIPFENWFEREANAFAMKKIAKEIINNMYEMSKTGIEIKKLLQFYNQSLPVSILNCRPRGESPLKY